MHCFEGPQWLHLKKGRESFARGPLNKADPLGRCAGVLVYGLQMIILKAAEVFPASFYFIYVISALIVKYCSLTSISFDLHLLDTMDNACKLE